MVKENEYIVFGAPQITDDEIMEVTDSLKSGWIGTGPKVSRFEEMFSRYKEAPYAIAVNSCTAALFLSMKVLGIGSGDEVITTPLTFCATINAIIHVGATPVLVDVDPDTMNIDTNKIAAAITSRTKAILPVHFAGRACDMDALMKIKKEYNLFLVEDCAHAVETRYKGQPVGTFGDLGCFSFYVTKNIMTGEGGMITTHNKEYAERLKILALHGMSHDAWRRFSDNGYKHYLVTELGYKYNMMDLQASLGIHQLSRVEEMHSKREKFWNRYMDELQDLPLILPHPVCNEDVHAHHLFTVLIDEKSARLSRDSFIKEMHNSGIGCGVHYLSVPEHPYYQKEYGWGVEHYPVATKIGRSTISLPLSPVLLEDDQSRIIKAVKKILEND